VNIPYLPVCAAVFTSLNRALSFTMIYYTLRGDCSCVKTRFLSPMTVCVSENCPYWAHMVHVHQLLFASSSEAHSAFEPSIRQDERLRQLADLAHASSSLDVTTLATRSYL